MRIVQKMEPSRGILERGRSCAARSTDNEIPQGRLQQEIARREDTRHCERDRDAGANQALQSGCAFDTRKVVDEAPEHEWNEGLWLKDGQRRGQRRDRAGRRPSRRDEQAIRKRGAEEDE